jgi:hypothetical protein
MLECHSNQALKQAKLRSQSEAGGRSKCLNQVVSKGADLDGRELLACRCSRSGGQAGRECTGVTVEAALAGSFDGA